MIGKRKLNTHTFCIDQKKNAITPKKPPTKAEISNELKVIKKLNVALEEENKKYVEKIKGLEEKVKALDGRLPEIYTVRHGVTLKSKLFCKLIFVKIFFTAFLYSTSLY